MKAPTICEDCEKVFQGGPHAFICPGCRKKRLSEAARRRRLNEMGNDAYSEQRAIAKFADQTGCEGDPAEPQGR